MAALLSSRLASLCHLSVCALKILLIRSLLCLLQDASPEHVMSMVVMLKEKFRENVPAWDGFASHPDVIPALLPKAVQPTRGAAAADA